ncbi:MAG: hypothetical protein HYT87_07135 [Nitrospirae bacterium]|nr:hypothetical protein [Nitrospirota bacterium]
MGDDHRQRDEQPNSAETGIPLWIKLMWAAGIIWILGYVYLGLQHTPENW